MSDSKKTGETKGETLEMIKIDSLDKLKQELKITTLDTSKDTILEAKKLNFEISRKELDDLTTMLLGIPGNTEKLERLKKIIEGKEVIKAKTGKETDKLKSELEILPISPEGMQKAFDYIKENNITGAHKYILIETILNKFIYSNGLTIKDEAIFVSKFEVIDPKTGVLNKEYSKVLDKNLSANDYEETKVFQTSMREGGFKKKAESIANKYNISLKFENEAEKNQLISEITTSKMSDPEKTMLIKYINGGYKKIEDTARDYTKQTEKNLKGAKQELQKATGVEWTDEKMADYARNPDKLVGDVFSNLAKNPLLLLSTFGLILGKIFGFNVTGEKSFLMKIFAVGTGVGLYKALGVGDLVGDSMEGKYNGNFQAGKEKMGVAWNWASGIVKQIPDKISGSVQELTNRVSTWYNFRNYTYTSNGVATDIIDSNFQSLYIDSKTGTPVITSKPGSKQDPKDSANLRLKINELYNEGVRKHGKNFDQLIIGKTLKEVIDIATNNPTTQPNKPQSAPAGQGPVAPAQSRITGIGQTPAPSVSQQIPVTPTQSKIVKII